MFLGWQGSSECRVSVLIEGPGVCEYRTWRGRSLGRLKRKARERYAREFPGACVRFGRPIWSNSYGAH